MVTVNSDLWLIEIAMCKAEQSKIGQQNVSKLDGLIQIKFLHL